MDRWIAAALDYVPRWLELQMRLTGQTGCAVAIAHRGRPVLELALGHADVDARARLTSRHRFRVASHSKTFTSAGVMKLRDAGRLRLGGWRLEPEAAVSATLKRRILRPRRSAR